MAVPMVMRSRAVGPGAKLDQLNSQVIATGDGESVKLLPGPPEEAFDAPVSPKSVRVGSSTRDPEPVERRLHQGRVATRFIVHPQPLRQAELAERAD